jgi:hypothetical protein
MQDLYLEVTDKFIPTVYFSYTQYVIILTKYKEQATPYRMAEKSWYTCLAAMGICMCIPCTVVYCETVWNVAKLLVSVCVSNVPQDTVQGTKRAGVRVQSHLRHDITSLCYSLPCAMWLYHTAHLHLLGHPPT